MSIKGVLLETMKGIYMSLDNFEKNATPNESSLIEQLHEKENLPYIRVKVIDVEMEFGSMVVLLVKWALAAIPALFIMIILGAIFGGVVGVMFHR